MLLLSWNIASNPFKTERSRIDIEAVEQRVKELERKLRASHERIQSLEKKTAEKDETIKEYWEQIQSMRLLNRIRRLYFVGPLIGWLADMAAQIKFRYLFERNRALVIQKFRRNQTVLDEGPLVTVVMVTNPAFQNLTKLNSVLAAGGYSSYEVVVIAQESSIGGPARSTPNMKWITPSVNESESETLNKVFESANGELILLLERDFNPVRGWLTELVALYQFPPDHEPGLTSPVHLCVSDKDNGERTIALQYEQLFFQVDPFRFHLAVHGPEKDPLQLNSFLPVVTATLLPGCVIMKKSAFLRAGGFENKFTSVSRTIDLSIRMHFNGLSNYLCYKSAVLDGPGKLTPTEWSGEIKEEESIILASKWYRKLYQEILLQKLIPSKGNNLTSMPFTVAIAIHHDCSTHLEIVLYEELLGVKEWNIIELNDKEDDWYKVPAEADLLIVASDQYDITQLITHKHVIKVLFAKPDYSPKHLIHRYDMVLASEELIANQIIAITGVSPVILPIGKGSDSTKEVIQSSLLTWNQSRKIAIKVPATDWNHCKGWGDFHFAVALKKQFAKLGYKASIELSKYWYDGNDSIADYVLVLRGLKEYKPQGRHKNFLWLISHPGEVNIQEYANYDHVFIASENWTNYLSAQGVQHCSVLMQCTDPEIFRPPSKEEAIFNELLFIGNSRGVHRKIIKDLLPTNYDLSIYGKSWQEWVDQKYVKGDHIENTELYKFYGGATILLNDHWDDMRNSGFISNRIFDGLSAGAFIISDDAKGLTHLLGDAIVVYESAEDLKSKINYYMENDEERLLIAKKGREIAGKLHTFEARAKEIVRIINQGVI